MKPIDVPMAKIVLSRIRNKTRSAGLRNDLYAIEKLLDFHNQFIGAYDKFVSHPAYGDFDMADEAEVDELIALERTMMDARSKLNTGE